VDGKFRVVYTGLISLLFTGSGKPLSCKERGLEFSPFPCREAGALVRSWGVRSSVDFST
jgi:hypothetical protein